MAALSLQGQSDRAAFVAAFTGSHIYVAEYLVDEVLQRQPADRQAFLLQTALLERLTAGLCDAVTGRQDGQALLAELQRTNLFLIPLDGEGRWFRYHHLFADLLRARLPQALPPGGLAGLHTRASVWYEQNGFTAEAIQHALAALDFTRAAALVDQAAHSLVMYTDRLVILRGWLDALPEEPSRTIPAWRSTASGST